MIKLDFKTRYQSTLLLIVLVLGCKNKIGVSLNTDTDRQSTIDKVVKSDTILFESDSTVFRFTEETSDGIKILKIQKYNKLSESYSELYPNNESEAWLYGYKDAKVFNDHLYVIAKTGVCGGPGLDCDVYSYDLKNGNWKDIIICGEDCEFVGNKIKAPIYWVTKYGDCTATNEYEDSVQWINLE